MKAKNQKGEFIDVPYTQEMHKISMRFIEECLEINIITMSEIHKSCINALKAYYCSLNNLTEVSE